MKIRFPKSLNPIVITTAPSKEKKIISSGDPQPVNCIFNLSIPSSVVNNGNTIICKYSESSDATSSDSATFHGGPRVVDISLAPIFFGSPWLNATPSVSEVMDAIRKVLESPYLSQMSQYGFHSLTVHQPVLKTVTSPPASHTTGDAGDVVWDLIDNGVFPEPDEAGGSNLYMVFFPPGTALTGHDWCGWHDAFSDWEPFDLDWAWVGAVDFPKGGDPKQTLDNIIKVFSHELIEMISDPEPNPVLGNGWTMNREINEGDEIGDACNQTSDFVNGFLVNAYWSEVHKACIIPKPVGFVQVAVKKEILSTTPFSSGASHFDNILCLLGDYKWNLVFQEQKITLTAVANFESTTFSWKLPQVESGPWSAPDQFSGSIQLKANTWFEDTNGVSYGVKSFPVEITVRGGTLTITNSQPLNLFNFFFKAEVTAMEGALRASTFKQSLVESESFKFEDAYYKVLNNCYERLHRQLVDLRPTIQHIGPDDRPWRWEDKLSSWISGERLSLVAETAAMAAAFHESNPALAQQLRSDAAFFGRVPLQLLMPAQAPRSPGRTAKNS